MNKEQIYDEKISPLMQKIIEICNEHKINAFASFCIPTPDDGGLRVTTCLPVDDDDGQDGMVFVESLRRVAQDGWGVHSNTFAMTITSSK